MGLLTFNREGAARFLADAEVAILAPYARLAHKKLLDGSGPGSDFTGWLRLPSGYDRDEYKRIKDSAAKIRGDSEVLIVIGIGGSYLGARAAIDTLSHNFVNLQNKAGRAGPQILYAGNSLSPTYLADLLELVDGRELSVNVISKSGTTTEPAIAFRVFKEYMEKRYGRVAAAKRIYATTDRKAGALKKLADEERYETFVIPDSVGGRFSVLTAVGLLPIAAAGIDTDALLSGAREAEDAYTATAELDRNDSLAYAVVRNALYRKGYTTEILANYEPNLHFFNEWWKQLYGESEGKDHKGIFPAAVDFTTDLHSMGQYVQDGLRNIFETVLEVGAPKRNLTVKSVEGDLDGLNFLAGRDLDYINKMAAKGTAEAHIDGGVPNLKVRFPALDAASFGSAVYFFEMACAVSGYLLGVNPFDQPGVEFYKRNMFKLLGKPGY